MKFGPIPLDEAIGGVVAHAVRLPGLVLKKGNVVTADHVAALRAAGVADIVVARLEAGDVAEDVAAERIATAVRGEGLRLDPPFTGRCNLRATRAGLLVAAPAAVDAVNAVDEAITLATLEPLQPVEDGEMVATVKIIPFAVEEEKLDRALAAARGAVLSVAAFRPLAVNVVSTLLPGLKNNTVNKTLRVLAERLAPAGARILSETRVPHEAGALKAALEAVRGGDLTIVFGASAITDRRDVIPSAIEQAGGRIEHFGMPVDPGNLMLLARGADGRPVLGAPGCARSPKENGFDFVLQRMLADVPVTGADIKRMGAGGLLKEIVSRPQPRGGGETQGDE